MGLTFRLGQVPLAIFTDTSNNVGIGGAANASFKLQVSGSVNLAGNVTTTGAQFVQNGFYLTNTNAGTTAGYTNLWGATDGIFFGLRNGTGGGKFIFQSATSYDYTFPSATGTIALTSNLSAYLPLTGGTLTGALSGTSATFSGALQVGGTGSSTITIGDAVGSATDSNLRLRTGSTKYAWLIASQNNVAGFEITPSTAVGGTTFSTPALSILPTGAATFSSSVGIGVTPASWGGGYVALQTSSTGTFASNGTNGTVIGHNFYYDGTNDKYITSGVASRIFQFQGNIRFELAASGSAGANLSFSEAMRITSGGNVGIGTSSPSARLSIANSACIVDITSTTSTQFNALELKNGGGSFYVGQDNSSGSFYGGGAYAGCLYLSGAYPMTFFTNATERMRITSGGFLKQKANGGSYFGASYNEISNFNNVANDINLVLGLGANASTSGSYFLICANTASDRLYILGNGNVLNTNGSYGTISSDKRLKENIVSATPKLDDIMKLNVVNFNLIGNEDKHIGFIAQEMQEVFPSFVYENDTRKYDKEGNVISGLEDALGVKVGMEFAILVKAIQEQQAQIEELRQIVATK